MQKIKLFLFLILLFVFSNLWAEPKQFPVFSTVRYPAPDITHLVGDVPFTECELSDPTNTIYRELECAVVELPENYMDAEQGNKIEVFVARIKAVNKKSTLDPVLLIAGGPGQAATESFLQPWMGFQKLNTHRDLYFIDQRGTGKSNKLQCEVLDEESKTPDEKTKAFKACLDGFSADVRQYTTSVAVKDLEEVRKRLGFVQWNIYGVSYGTRVAQHYLRQYPKSVRTVILDGVVAPNHVLGTEVAIQSQRALELLFERCKKSDDCRKHFPDLSDKTHAFLNQLNEKPIALSFENFVSGQVENFELNSVNLASIIRMSLYSTEISSLLPVMLHAAFEDENYFPLARTVRSQRMDMSNIISMGMHNSVVCSEDIQRLSEKDIQTSKLLSKDTYMGPEFLEDLLLICELWPKGVVDDNFYELAKTDKPVMLLSGSADPITPPKYADAASEFFSQKIHIVAEGFAHGVSRVGCIPTLMAKFVEEQSAELDTSCLDVQQPSPIFVNFNGPSP